MVVRGGGDLGTGAARRLFLAGFRVLITELDQPWCVRRRTAFARTVAEGSVEVEGVLAHRIVPADLPGWTGRATVAVLVWPDSPHPPALRPQLLVDARVLKRGHDTRIDQAPRVIGVGPGFRVGRDCHAAVETVRGHDMGRVLYEGETQPFSGRPGDIAGEGERRVLRAPVAGTFERGIAIGEDIARGTPVGRVGVAAVVARVSGIVRGLLPTGASVRAGQKVGDVDPRGESRLCATLSDKANSVGGGVLEAALVLTARPPPRTR